MNSVENPRLTAAVTAYMAYSGDVNERMRVALAAADDVARVPDVSVPAQALLDEVARTAAGLRLNGMMIRHADRLIVASRTLRAALAAAPSAPEPQRDARVQRLVEAATLYAFPGDYTGRPSEQQTRAELQEALAPFRQPAEAAPQAARDATALHVSDARAALVTAAREAKRDPNNTTKTMRLFAALAEFHEGEWP